MLHLDRHGWLREQHDVTRMPSPNCDHRPQTHSISLLVIHNISLPPGEFGTPYVCDLFLNTLDYAAHPWFDRLRNLHVSAHFLIQRTGQITQFVSTEHRAWHAGISYFNNRERCNDFSIGIELEGTDTQPYTDTQYEALRLLTACLRSRYPLTDVRGHQHIAPLRKTDPGPYFDWVRYGTEANWLRRSLPEPD